MAERLKRQELDILQTSALFRGIAREDILKMADCLGAYVKKIPGEGAVFRAGGRVEEIGLVLSGGVRMEENDIWGNRNIIGRAGPGDVFAETYACIGKEPLMVDVIAERPCEILFLKLQKMLTTCPASCGFHSELIRNLTVVLAEKNLGLTRKIRLITPRSLRERVLAYLSQEALRQGKDEITIPFNRQQMADFLNVDRSALSGELSKMQKEGLIKYHKNRFVLHTISPKAD